jgi:hypothetical protein
MYAPPNSDRQTQDGVIFRLIQFRVQWPDKAVSTEWRHLLHYYTTSYWSAGQSIDRLEADEIDSKNVASIIKELHYNIAFAHTKKLSSETFQADKRHY